MTNIDPYLEYNEFFTFIPILMPSNIFLSTLAFFEE